MTILLKFVIPCAALAIGFAWGVLAQRDNIFPKPQLLTLAERVGLKAKPAWDAVRPYEPVDIVMVGDSLMALMPWDDVFRSVSIANRGAGGDTTARILARMDAIRAVRARKAFVMAGANDLAQGIPVEDVFANYKRIVEALLADRVRVHILATLDCTRSVCSWADEARALNRRLAGFARDRGLAFIDLNPRLSSDAEGLLDAYSQDGVHLNNEGYHLWVEAITPYVKDAR